MDAFDPSPISLLDRERIVARPGFNRWLVPPAALAIHLCIGMAYGFSVFWLPLSRALGVTKSVVCKDMSLIDALTTTTCDWRGSDVTVMYTLFFVFLGSSAAGVGGWLERAGPRQGGGGAAPGWGIRPFFFPGGGVAPPPWVVVVRAGGGGVRAVLVHRPLDLRGRRRHPPAVADVARLGRDRRRRARPGLHLAGLDADQVVSGSPRHGDRHGDHGVRRRRDDRRPAGRQA